MRKWIGRLSSLLLILILVLVFRSFHTAKQSMPGKERKDGPMYTLVQGREKEEIDPHYLQVLKKLQEQLDEWLKALNERIESQDVTRFEVRFLEILRNILEWVKEKVDAKIESYEKMPKKERKDIFRETFEKYTPFSVKG